jgi:hypothetical protein
MKKRAFGTKTFMNYATPIPHLISLIWPMHVCNPNQRFSATPFLLHDQVYAAFLYLKHLCTPTTVHGLPDILQCLFHHRPLFAFFLAHLSLFSTLLRFHSWAAPSATTAEQTRHSLSTYSLARHIHSRYTLDNSRFSHQSRVQLRRNSWHYTSIIAGEFRAWSWNSSTSP